jgi:hypothetical protein
VTSLLAALAAAAALFASACSNGLSTQDAYRACKAIGQADATSTSFAACVACFEDCDDCTPEGTVPETFSCPDDDADTTASSDASSSSGGG